jgi:hypothetical protein
MFCVSWQFTALAPVIGPDPAVQGPVGWFFGLIVPLYGWYVATRRWRIGQPPRQPEPVDTPAGVTTQ